MNIDVVKFMLKSQLLKDGIDCQFLEVVGSGFITFYVSVGLHKTSYSVSRAECEHSVLADSTMTMILYRLLKSRLRSVMP